jgi:hypothetical protein
MSKAVKIYLSLLIVVLIHASYTATQAVEVIKKSQIKTRIIQTKAVFNE